MAATRDALSVLAMAMYAALLCALWLVPLLVVAALCRWSWWPLALAAAWTAYDWDTCNTGGARARRRLRGWLGRQADTWWGRGLLEYCPLRVVVAAGARMDPRKSYLLSWHPHAFVPALQVTAMLPALFSEQLAAALPGGQVPVAFPGLDVLVATKPAFFLLPVLREVALALGFISCSERSLRHALRLPGKAVLLMTGAVQEVFRTRGDTNVFCLQRRGFCRVALAEGASLVPVVVLGENRGYRMLLPDAMEWLHSATGWRAVLPMGRGVLQDYVGVMPRRVPITVVVGAPIEVTATRSPSRQQVAALHASFVDAVRRLYDEHAPAHYKEHVPLVIET